MCGETNCPRAAEMSNRINEGTGNGIARNSREMGRIHIFRPLAYLWRARIWADTNGQELLEYCCFMAAIVLLYAAFSPSVASGVVNVFTKVTGTLSKAAG